MTTTAIPSTPNTSKKPILTYLIRFITHYVLLFFLLSFVSMLIWAFLDSVFIFTNYALHDVFPIAVPLLALFALTVIIHFITRKRPRARFKRSDAITYSVIFCVFIVADLIALFASGFSFHAVAPLTVVTVCAVPFFPFIFFYSFSGMASVLHFVILAVLFFISAFAWIVTRKETADTKQKLERAEKIHASVEHKCAKKPTFVKAFTALTVVALVGTGGMSWAYLSSPAYKYKGHDFEYMNGYSSTDFTDYTPYAEPSKLVMLDHKPSLVIDDEKDMPVLDGAEACYPLYSSVAKNVYMNIGEIEQKALRTDSDYTNGKIVSFTNSFEGYLRLQEGEVDIFFGAKPSEDMIQEAKDEGKEFRLRPIGHEGFVFFVEKNNPIENITSEQMKDIYSGKITNWKEVGGLDQEILAFQRPDESGSQIMMKHYMGDVPLKEPMTYEVFDSMGGVIDVVAEYGHDKGAIGYTFRYFLEGLHQEEGVKMLSIDGVYPSVENISNGTYPLVTDLYAVTLESNDDPNVQAMLDFLVSPDGQEIVERSGYAPLLNRKANS